MAAAEAPQSAGDDTQAPAPTTPAAPETGGVTVTALPNTGTGAERPALSGGAAIWLLVLGAAGMIGTTVIRKRTA
jgi:hypothetical protein